MSYEFMEKRVSLPIAVRRSNAYPHHKHFDILEYDHSTDKPSPSQTPSSSSSSSFSSLSYLVTPSNNRQQTGASGRITKSEKRGLRVSSYPNPRSSPSSSPSYLHAAAKEDGRKVYFETNKDFPFRSAPLHFIPTNTKKDQMSKDFSVPTSRNDHGDYSHRLCAYELPEADEQEHVSVANKQGYVDRRRTSDSLSVDNKVSDRQYRQRSNRHQVSHSRSAISNCSQTFGSYHQPMPYQNSFSPVNCEDEGLREMSEGHKQDRTSLDMVMYAEKGCKGEHENVKRVKHIGFVSPDYHHSISTKRQSLQTTSAVERKSGMGSRLSLAPQSNHRNRTTGLVRFKDKEGILSESVSLGREMRVGRRQGMAEEEDAYLWRERRRIETQSVVHDAREMKSEGVSQTNSNSTGIKKNRYMDKLSVVGNNKNKSCVKLEGCLFSSQTKSLLTPQSFSSTIQCSTKEPLQRYESSTDIKGKSTDICAQTLSTTNLSSTIHPSFETHTPLASNLHIESSSSPSKSLTSLHSTQLPPSPSISSSCQLNVFPAAVVHRKTNDCRLPPSSLSTTGSSPTNTPAINDSPSPFSQIPSARTNRFFQNQPSDVNTNSVCLDTPSIHLPHRESFMSVLSTVSNPLSNNSPHPTSSDRPSQTPLDLPSVSFGSVAVPFALPDKHYVRTERQTLRCSKERYDGCLGVFDQENYADPAYAEHHQRTMSDAGVYYAVNGSDVNGNAVNHYDVNDYAVNGNAVNHYDVNDYAVNGNAVNDYAVSGSDVKGNAVNHYDVSDYDVNGNAVNHYDVNDYAVNGNAVNAYAVNGSDVNGNAVNHYDVNDYDVNGNAVSDYAVNGSDVNGNSVNHYDVNDYDVNGNAVSDYAVNGTAVNGAAVNDYTVNGNAANGTAGNGNAVNDYAVNGTSVNGNAVNDYDVNGTAVNDYTVNDYSVNDYAVNDYSVNGNDVDGSAVNGSAVNGYAGNGNAVNYNAVNRNAVNGNADNWNAVNGNAGNGNKCNGNAGNGNTCNGNAGNGNTCNGNAGNGNAGTGNTCNGNAGNGNAGNGNAGNGNAVNRNAVNGNAGNGNAVNRNAVNGNAGNGNVVNRNAVNGNACNGNGGKLASGIGGNAGTCISVGSTRSGGNSSRSSSSGISNVNSVISTATTASTIAGGRVTNPAVLTSYHKSSPDNRLNGQQPLPDCRTRNTNHKTQEFLKPSPPLSSRAVGYCFSANGKSCISPPYERTKQTFPSLYSDMSIASVQAADVYDPFIYYERPNHYGRCNSRHFKSAVNARHFNSLIPQQTERLSEFEHREKALQQGRVQQGGMERGGMDQGGMEYEDARERQRCLYGSERGQRVRDEHLFLVNNGYDGTAFTCSDLSQPPFYKQPFSVTPKSRHNRQGNYPIISLPSSAFYSKPSPNPCLPPFIQTKSYTSPSNLLSEHPLTSQRFHKERASNIPSSSLSLPLYYYGNRVCRTPPPPSSNKQNLSSCQFPSYHPSTAYGLSTPTARPVCANNVTSLQAAGTMLSRGCQDVTSHVNKTPVNKTVRGPDGGVGEKKAGGRATSEHGKRTKKGGREVAKDRRIGSRMSGGSHISESNEKPAANESEPKTAAATDMLRSFKDLYIVWFNPTCSSAKCQTACKVMFWCMIGLLAVTVLLVIVGLLGGYS